MTPAGLNTCFKHVEEWSGSEAWLLLGIIPGSGFCSTCQHSNCVGLAAATVILVSVWCFQTPEDSTTSARSPPSSYHPDCFQVQRQCWGDCFSPSLPTCHLSRPTLFPHLSFSPSLSPFLALPLLCWSSCFCSLFFLITYYKSWRTTINFACMVPPLGSVERSSLWMA